MTPSTSRSRIRTPDQRLRVFVSSTLGELAQERHAVSRAVAALRMTPVMFELGAFLRHESEGAQRPAGAPPSGAAGNGADAPLPGVAASWEPVR